MTRILRLLLIAAVAWPLCHPAAAQEVMQETLEGRQVAKQLTPEASKFVTVPSLDEAKPSNRQNSQIEESTEAKVNDKQGRSNHALTVVYPTDLKIEGKAHKAPSLKADPPASVTAEDWNISTNFFNNADGGFVNYPSTVKVAIDGNNIYVSGLCYWLTDAWVQGTIDGNTATFPSGQYYGNYANNYDMYFVGTNNQHSTICDVTFTYNSSTKTLRLNDNLLILVGANTTGGYYAYHMNTVIAKEYVDPPVEVGIAEGTDANQRVPIYGEGYDLSTTSQMIYPASMLSDFEDGRKIKSVTFYTNDNGIQFSGGSITATIGTTSNTYFPSASALTISGATATATVVPSQGSKTLKIVFDNPLIYTAGSNIIIQLVNTTTGSYSATTWWGVQYGSGNTYYSYSSKGTGNISRFIWTNDNTSPARLRYMPKATFELISDPVVLTDELDFEVVEVGQNKTLTAYVENANNEPVTATVTATAPFSVASSTVTLQPGATGIDVTFTPTEANAYNGTLTVDVGGSIITITLKGVGNTPGVIVVPDKDFFDGITYNWNDDNGATHTSKLSDIATDPNQIIALLRTVYTNKTIPGNYKRGCDANGNFTEQFSDVSYAAIGSLEYSGSSTSAANLTSPGNYSYNDDIGWNIPNFKPVICKTQSYSNRTTYYTTFDQTEYKPYNEGLTMLLVEIPDDYDRQTFTIDYTDIHSYSDLLKYYVSHAMKSARIVPNAKRTGQGQNAGTLFKIDCDKMNKFFLLAKGQLRLPFNSKLYQEGSSMSDYYYFENCNFSPYPMYVYADRYYGQSGLSVNNFWDYNNGAIFSHMFEQFSPVVLSTGDDATDLYQSLVNMESFGVYHDCVSVPFAYSGDDTHGHGHQFMMYGQESSSEDCQDVRDLMFFVPDYRMMKDSGRDTELTDYLNYNIQHQPKMGLYVIRQNEITPTTAADNYYMLNLNWVTNLDDFLPGEDQEFELLQVVINEETGIEEYKPVYYMNAQGQYTDANGTVVSTPVPIVLHLGPGAEKNYPNVYVERQSSSQQVTYAIRGRDTGHFLSLQISNRQSYIIPGTDPQELVSLIELAHYSRYNPENEENCYSNRFKLSNNVGGLTRDNMSDAQNTQNVFTFTRKTSSTDENPVTIATATVINQTDNGGTITIVMESQDEETEFPRAKNGSGYAGYHANPGDGTTWTVDFTYKTVNGKEYVDFGDFVLCDNFIAKVSENAHPNQYIYEVKFNIVSTTDHNFDEAHGSAFRVPIYKTASKVNNAYSLIEVKGDKDHANVVGDLTFSERVQYSSKTEILRYDVYRWPAGETRYIVNSVGENDAEQDLAPDGIAGNQGEGYTVTMNDVDGDYYYHGGEIAVSSGTAWADFVDYYPAKVAKNTEEAKAYVYAPVVETFTVGKNVIGEARTDYNTYGGPQQVAAVGVLDIDEPRYEISSYSWLVGNDRYAYYTVELPVKTDLVPNGYKIYMVRAWRVVEPELLGERAGLFEERKTENGEYMFEEMLNVSEEGGEYQPSQHMSLGGTEITTAHYVDGEVIEGVCRGTFGARKIRTSGSQNGDVNDGTIEELPMTFRVRLYFTPENTSKAGEQDKTFYIAEYTTDFSIKGGIPTGIVDVMNAKQVVGEKYYNPAGIESDTPFKGVNIVVTRYSDGSTTTTKILK